MSINYGDGTGGVNKAKEELPWNVDWVLVLTAECWEAVGTDTEAGRDWGRDCEEGNEGCTWPSEEGWRLEEGRVFTGPWTKSLNSSSSSEKPVLGTGGEGWMWAWEERPKVEEVEEEEEEDGGKEAGASTGPWKSLNSSLSSDKAGGREWVETDGCDGDESAKMKT